MFDWATLEMQLRAYVLPIIIFFSMAYIVHRLAYPIAKRMRPLGGDITMRDNPRRYERLRTLQALLSSAVSILGFILATFFSMTLFVSADTLLWIVGLFSAAFGLGARPFISDFLTGLSFIFEDTFDVGDKIEIPLSPHAVEGVVEKVTLRVTQIRGMNGELYTMPNGDIRILRNFSRGDSSHTSVTVTIPAAQLTRALDHLEGLSERAMMLLPNLIAPWKIISESGALGEDAELTVLAQTKYGKGADLRTRLMALIHQELSAIDVLTSSDDNIAVIPDK